MATAATAATAASSATAATTTTSSASRFKSPFSSLRRAAASPTDEHETVAHHLRATSAHVNFSTPRPITPDVLSAYSDSNEQQHQQQHHHHQHSRSGITSAHGTIHSTAHSTAQHSRSSSRAQRADPSYVAPRSKRGTTGMLDIDRPHTRRDRTFAGAECAACEEPLELTLRGEKVLQLSCGHVSHEACFYEYIREFEALSCPVCEAPLGLDTTRGGNVLDLEKLGSAYRAHALQEDYRSAKTAPSQYANSGRESRQVSYQASLSDRRRRHTKISSRGSKGQNQLAHGRNTSEGTRSSTLGPASTLDASIMSGRPEVEYGAPTASPRMQPVHNPIPPPTITIRSEYPTINRSSKQQSLTCLVTVEMPEGKWKPSIEDLRRVAEQTRQDAPEAAGEVQSPRKSTHRRHESHMSEVPELPEDLTPEAMEELDRLTENLISRVDNWHGLDYTRFGHLRLHDTLLVGKDRQSWQELECYLFGEMLICVKEKKMHQTQGWNGQDPRKCTLKGSIMIKKHLADIEQTFGDDEDEDSILTLSLSVPELPTFHLQFPSLEQLDRWREALFALGAPDGSTRDELSDDGTVLSTEYDDNGPRVGALSSTNSIYTASKSYNTAPTEVSEPAAAAALSSSSSALRRQPLSYSLHVPIDIVVVMPLSSSSMHGLKMTLLKDLVRFLTYSLGERDRLGLVTFGAGGGAMPLARLTTKDWPGWEGVVESLRAAAGPRGARVDPVEGANVAMDMLMQRKSSNAVSSILLVSDSPSAEEDSVDFVVSRAEAARVSIYSFGLGLNHKPDALIALSQRTKASYLYVRDWMMLRECVAGVLGSLQSVCHAKVVLKLRTPDGSPGKFVKLSGALVSSTRASGREAEASLGDLRFGEKRDVLVQLAVAPEASPHDHGAPKDHWETIVSDLEALGGSGEAEVDSRHDSIDELPMLQAHVSFGDVLRDGAVTQTARPSLLTITVLPAAAAAAATRPSSKTRPTTPPIPPHPSVVQRRMELLTSDMMSRALTLVSRGQNDRAQHLLQETRGILKGLGKGGLPPLPPPVAAMAAAASSSASTTASTTSSSAAGAASGEASNGRRQNNGQQHQQQHHHPNSSSPLAAAPHQSHIAVARKTTSPAPSVTDFAPQPPPPQPSSPGPSAASHMGQVATTAAGPGPQTPLPPPPPPPPVTALLPAPGIDFGLVVALDAELATALEWIAHPAVFARDARKAVLQAIGVASSQRAYTFRTGLEGLWAGRVLGVRAMCESAGAWGEWMQGELVEEH